MTTSRPTYESMRDWTIDRKRAELAAEQEGISQSLQREREKYVEWLDKQRPDWLAERKEEQ